jgi:hypothetical protein
MTQTVSTLPLGNDVPWYTFSVGLSGVQYQLTVRYNTRMSRWALDIADAMGNPVLSSVTLLIDRILGGQFHYLAGFPPGTFFVLDNTNTGTQPTRYSFGTGNTAYYATPPGS